MAHFVAQHSGQFVAVADSANQAQMHTKIPAGQCKGVDAFVAQQKKLPGKAFVELRAQITPRPRCVFQRLPDALYVVDQHRIVHKIRVAVDTCGNSVANAPFSSSSEVRVVAK